MADTHTHDFDTASAATLVKAVIARKVSALELTDAAIARIERLNPPLNAVIVKDFDRARDAARAADAAQAKGLVGALQGVPMTVKESHNVAGLPTTWGFEVARNNIASEDSLGVTRLKSAGAIILGKTNVPPALGDWQSANPVYGRTNNPFDLGRSPGGSSGGGAAALASGMVALEFGSDIGGSIRIPAHFCGVFGHKPSFALIPMRGHMPPDANGAPPDLSVVGPLARTAEDIAIALGVLAGPDERDDGVGYKLALPAPRHAAIKDYRILVRDAHPLARADGETRAMIEAFAAKLERAGARVERESALLPDLAAAHRAYVSMLMTITSRRGDATGRPSIPSHQWLDIVDQRAILRRAWRTLFETFDVVVTPPFGVAAFAHTDEPDWSKRTLMIDGAPTPYGDQLAWPGVATFPGLPATAMPVAKTKAGLPIGVQVIAGHLEDRTAIAFADLASRL